MMSAGYGLSGSRDTDPVVGECAQHAHDPRSMPGAVLQGAARGRKQGGVFLIGAADPIARIRRVRIPAVAVVGDEEGAEGCPGARIQIFADEIIAREQSSTE